LKGKRTEERTVVAAGVVALALLALFMGINYYLNLQSLKSDPVSGPIGDNLPDTSRFGSTILARHDFESGNASDTATHLVLEGHQSKQSLRMNSWVQFSPGLGIRFSELHTADSCWIRVTGYVWFSCATTEVKCSLVATANRGGYNFRYFSLPLEKEPLKPGIWNRVSIVYRLPQYRLPDDLLQAYFWYRGSHEMLVDDIEVVYYSPKKRMK